MVSYGALTTVTSYNLIPKSEHVVDSVFMHDNYARTPTGARSGEDEEGTLGAGETGQSRAREYSAWRVGEGAGAWLWAGIGCAAQQPLEH